MVFLFGGTLATISYGIALSNTQLKAAFSRNPGADKCCGRHSATDSRSHPADTAYDASAGAQRIALAAARRWGPGSP